MDAQNNLSYQILSSALRQVISRPQLAIALKARDTREETMKKLNITDEIATEIFNILNVLEQEQQVADTEVDKKPTSEGTDEITTDKKFLLESFIQLRTAYRISMIMSSVMFIVGLSFLALAAIRSFLVPQSVAVTSVIGGIGIVQVVALFYRNPLTHISRTVSNAQQAKMSVMSYLIGISLLNQQIGLDKPSKDHLNYLIELTETALGQLQEYTESGKLRNDMKNKLKSVSDSQAKADQHDQTKEHNTQKN